ncbi:putative Solute carrier family 12 member 4-like protein, partial [Naja naja]
MPHFTVVPVEDQSRAGYDALEGLSWVDYSQPGADGAPRASCQRDPYDSVSSDGEWRGSGWAGWVDTLPNAPGTPLGARWRRRRLERRLASSGNGARSGLPGTKLAIPAWETRRQEVSEHTQSFRSAPAAKEGGEALGGVQDAGGFPASVLDGAFLETPNFMQYLFNSYPAISL